MKERTYLDPALLSHAPIVRSRQVVLNCWLWELGAILMSIGLMICTAVVLYRVQDTPLSLWKLLLQPNSLVSVLLTLSKTSMLVVLSEGISQLKWVYFQQRSQRVLDFEHFDQASRGPWGSFTFILRFRYKAALATTGAVLVVVSLAMDPFAQMVLSYPTKSTTIYSDRPFSSTARTFDPSLGAPGDDTIQRLTTALYQGARSQRTQVPYNCTNGNCNAQSFKSLGLCSTCEDVLTEVDTKCQSSSSGTGAKCDHTLPTGIVISTDWCQGDSGNPVSLRRLQPEDWPDGYLHPTTIANFSHLAFPTTSNSTLQRETYPSGCGADPISAWTCSIYFCGKSYESTKVVKGVLLDEATSVEPLIFPTPGSPISKCIPDTVWNHTYAGLAPAWTSSELPDLSSVTCPPANDDDEEATSRIEDFIDILRKDEKAYRLRLPTIKLIKSYVTGLFNTTLLTGTLDVANISTSICGIPDLINQAHGGNYSITIDDFVSILSNAIRQGPNDTVVLGSSWEMETYVEVHWQWLTLPAMNILLSATFFLATVMISTEKHGVAWKSASLPLLYHGLSREQDRDGFEQVDLSGMENAARKRQVRLERDDDGMLCMVTQ